MRYFVKPHFSGWKEVDKEHYERFIENIKKHASGMNEKQKQKHIAKATKIKE
jgi:hypothetical protein